MKDLESMAADVESFLSELLDEQYQNGAGLKDELETSPIYERYAHLFDGETVAELLRLQQQDQRHGQRDAEFDRRVRFLSEFATGAYLESTVKEAVDALTTEETRGVVRVDGEAIAHRELAVRIAQEPDRARRERLFQAREEFTRKLNGQRESIWKTGFEHIRALGFSSSLAMHEDLSGLDLTGLGRTMRSFLDATEAVYRDRFGSALRARSGVELWQGRARKHDVAWMMRATEFDALFAPETLIGALRQTLDGLGIDLDSQDQVTLDCEVRPKKSPRAFCAPIRVPQDVRLVILPRGGQDDYRSLLHEGGHTEHFAHTRPDLPVEFRYLGDNSVTEAFAFLFEYLAIQPSWLERILGVAPADAAPYVDFARNDRLYFLRRYAGKLLYELELHQAPDLSSMPPRYDDILSTATGIAYGQVDYLNDVDPGFYAADYLRAWALEVMLREHLLTRFGSLWFTKVQAGDFLRELWAGGQRETGDELGRRLGYDGVDFEPLTAELAGKPRPSPRPRA